MKIWHISDTHGRHNQIIVPKDIDIVIFSGDESNNRHQFVNHIEFLSFLNWYAELDIKHKIFVAGNHSSFIYHNEKVALKMMEVNNINLLNKTSITINGLKFYGDPISIEFNNWVYTAKREKMNKHWALIPEDTDILITHTPPKGILDLTLGTNNNLELCGCSALFKRIQKLPNLKANLFGHIHNIKDIINIGTRKIDNVIFSNASAVKDDELKKGIIHHGNIIETISLGVKK